MIKDVRQTLERKGYTADEIDVLLKSFTELLDTLREEATWKRFASRRAGQPKHVALNDAGEGLEEKFPVP